MNDVVGIVVETKGKYYKRTEDGEEFRLKLNDEILDGEKIYSQDAQSMLCIKSSTSNAQVVLYGRDEFIASSFAQEDSETQESKVQENSEKVEKVEYTTAKLEEIAPIQPYLVTSHTLADVYAKNIADTVMHLNVDVGEAAVENQSVLKNTDTTVVRPSITDDSSTSMNQQSVSNIPSNPITQKTQLVNSVTIDLATTSDSGISDTDNLTNDKTPTITGKTDIAFSKVEIIEAGKVIATTTSDASGHYSVDMPTLSDASHTLSAQASAPSSTTVVSSVDLNIVVDTNTVTHIALHDGNLGDNDDFLNASEQKTAVAMGKIEAGGTIDTLVITDVNGKSITVPSSDYNLQANGEFGTYTDLSSLADGKLTVEVKGHDKAGNTFDETASMDKDTSATSSVSLHDGNMSDQDDILNASEEKSAVAMGKLEAGSTIDNLVITDINGKSVIIPSSDYNLHADGRFGAQTDLTGLADGQLSVEVKGHDSAGNPFDETATMDKDTSTTAHIALHDGNMSDADDVLSASEQTKAVSMGKVEAGSSIDSLVISDVNGKSITIPASDYNLHPDGRFGAQTDLSGLADGQLSVEVKGHDSAGNPFDETATMDKDTSTTASVSLHDGNMGDADDVLNASEEKSAVAMGKIEAGGTIDTLVITDVNGKSITVPASDYNLHADGRFGAQTDLTGLADGKLSVEVKGHDSAGNPFDETATMDKDTIINATDDTATTTEDSTTAVSGSVLTNDDHTNGETATASSALTTAHGVYTLNTDGTYTFTVNNAASQSLAVNESATDTLTYTVTDKAGNTTTATLTTTITGTNDTPTLAVNQVDNISGTLAQTDVDTTDTHEFSVVAGSGHFGTLTVDATTGAYTYAQTPSVSGMNFDKASGTYSGKDVFEVKVDDHHGGVVSKFITIDATATVGASTVAGGLPVITPAVTTQPTVTTTAPVATTTQTTPPTNTVTIDLDATSDSGTSDTDNITNDKTPTITGSTDIPFSKVEILEAGKVIATTTSDASGHYSVDTPALSDASHTLSAQATAPSSINSVTSGNLDLTVDTTINATDDTATTTEDATTAVSGSVLTNDDHANGETASATTALKTAHGTYTLNTDGTYTFTVDNAASQSLAVGQSATDTLAYEITDKAGNTTTATLTTTITGTNDAAVIISTPVDVTEDTNQRATITLGITDSDAGEVKFQAGTLTGAHGSATLNEAGVLVYTLDNSNAQNLNAGQSITDTITVTSKDGTTHDVSVTINGTNDNPIINIISSASATEDGSVVSGTITSTDVDTGDYSTFTAGTTPAGFTLNTNGSYSFDPTDTAYQHLKVGETETIRVAITATDTHNGTSPVSELVIIVTGTNDAPTIQIPPAFTAIEDGVIVSGQILSQDSDTGDTATFTTSSAPAGFTLSTDGTYSFDPSGTAYQYLAQGETQTITIPVKVTDSASSTDIKDLVITLTGTNDAPTLSVNQTTNTTGTLVETDVDTTDTHTFSIPSGTGHYGTLSLDPVSGDYQYTQSSSVSGMNFDSSTGTYSGTDIFEVQVDDHHGGVVSKFITIDATATVSAPLSQGALPVITTVVSTPPTVTTTAPMASTIQTTPPTNAVTIDLDATSDSGTSNTDNITNDKTPTITGSTDIPFSKVEILEAGKVIATTTSDASGAYSVDTPILNDAIYTLSAQATAPSSTSSVTSPELAVTVDTNINAADDAATTTEDTTTAVSGSVLSNDDHANGETAKASSPLTTAHGVYTLNTDGTYTFTVDNAASQSLAANESATDTLTYDITDKAGNTTTATLTTTITGTNDAPIITTIAPQSAIEGGSVLSGSISATDVDNGDSFTFASATPVLGFHLNANGTYSFDPANPGYNHLSEGEIKTITIPVTVTDSVGGSETQDLVITLTGTNDIPVMLNAPSVHVHEDDALFKGQLMTTDPDAGDVITYTQNAPIDGFTLHPDGSYSFDLTNPTYNHLAAGQRVNIEVPISAADGHGGTASQTLHFTISGTDDAPVISATPMMLVDEDQSLQGKITASDADDGDTLTFSTPVPTPGLTLHTDGSYTFDAANSHYQHLAAGQQVEITIPVFATDAYGLSDQVQVKIQITGTNDKPIIGGVDQAIGAVGNAVGGSVQIDGNLVIVDIDDGESSFQAQLIQGKYGVLGIDAQGHWQYTADATQSGLTALTGSSHADEAFTVLSADGTHHDIALKITGDNTPAIFGGVSTGMVKENTVNEFNGHLSVMDVNAGEDHVVAVDRATPHGHFTIDASGTWNFKLDNTNTEVQALGEGKMLVEQVLVGSADGTPHMITINVVGTNDAPQISGVTTGAIDEDGSAATVEGTLVGTDVDVGDTLLWGVDGSNQGQYGSLSVDTSTGKWTYSIDNTLLETQQLADGATGTETFSVKVQDSHGEEALQTITVKVNGTNDAAVITGTDTGSVQEDVNQTTTDTLEVSGKLDITDLDDGEAVFNVARVGGGKFIILPDGNWHYEADNNKVQDLAEGETKTEEYIVSSKDGTHHTVTITITGTNDVPTVSSATTLSSGTEDTSVIINPADLLTHASDVDTTDTLSVHNLQANHGVVTQNTDGTFTFVPAQDYNGKVSFTYDIQDSHGGTVATSASMDLAAVQDAAIITGDVTGSIDEDATTSTILIVSGLLGISDVDSPESFNRETIHGTNGELMMKTDGHWTFLAHNDAPDIQNLGPAETLAEHFVVTSSDGTQQAIDITIHGTIDAPTLTATHETTAFNPIYADAIASYTQQSMTAIDFLGMGAQSIVTPGGKLDLSLAEAQRVHVTSSGIGVDDGRVATAASDRPENVINTGETLLVHLQGEARSAQVKLFRFESESSGGNGISDDKVHWIAYDHNGNKISEGDAVPDSDASKNGIINIHTTAPFTYIAIEAIDNPNSFVTTSTGPEAGISAFTVSEVEAQLISYDTKIDLGGHLSDTSSSEVLSYRVTGLDARSGFSHGTQNADGSWTISVTEATDLSLHHASDLHLSIEAIATDGSVVASSTAIALDISHQVVDYELLGGDHRATTDEDAIQDVTGDLNIDASAAGVHEFVAQSVTTTHGTFSMNTQGHWTYHVDTAASQSLVGQDYLSEIFTVQTNTGVSKDIEVTLRGQDDATVLGGNLNGDVKEDDSGQNTAQGQVSFTDPDSSNEGLLAHDYKGTYGSLHVNSDGSWAYTLDNSLSATQALSDGQTEHESFNQLMETIDGKMGTTKTDFLADGTIDISVHGSDEGVSATVSPAPAPAPASDEAGHGEESTVVLHLQDEAMPSLDNVAEHLSTAQATPTISHEALATAATLLGDTTLTTDSADVIHAVENQQTKEPVKNPDAPTHDTNAADADDTHAAQSDADQVAEYIPDAHNQAQSADDQNDGTGLTS